MDLELVVLEHRHLVVGQLDMVMMEGIAYLREAVVEVVLVVLEVLHPAPQHLAAVERVEHLVLLDLR